MVSIQCDSASLNAAMVKAKAVIDALPLDGEFDDSLIVNGDPPAPKPKGVIKTRSVAGRASERVQLCNTAIVAGDGAAKGYGGVGAGRGP